jgi:DNA-directed RNA polymerase subunit RPC12/RpoP
MPFLTIDDEGNYLSCPECGSSNLTRKGFKKTTDGLRKQRWLCSYCNYRTIYPARNSRDGIRVDLNSVKNIKGGYTVTEETQAYHAKSYDKLHKPVTIMKIQV